MSPFSQMECIDELLQKNRVLQEELLGFLSFVENVQTKNEEARNLSEALILTRQQARNKSARPSRASVNLDGPDLRVSGGAQMTSSLWCHDGNSPSLSEDSNIAAEVLSRVPPCFKSSFFWNAKEIQSLCCGVLSIVQQKLMEYVFRGVLEEQEDEMEMLRQGIEECRKMRLDSKIAIGVANELTNEDWRIIAERFLQKRTAAECRIQWMCFVRPDRNQRPFATSEATELKSIAQRHNCANWEDIARELGTGRHPAECLRFYRQHFDCGNRKWSQEEDLQISTAWESGGLDSLKVLNITLGRDIRSVVARSRQIRQSHQFRTGKWQKQEDLKLLKSVLRHGMDWESVSKDVKHRSPAQCRERFVYSIEPSLHRDKGSRWTQEDTEELKVLVEEHLQRFGKVKWSLLAKSFCGISPRDLLNKWNFMMEQNATQ